MNYPCSSANKITFYKCESWYTLFHFSDLTFQLFMVQLVRSWCQNNSFIITTKFRIFKAELFLCKKNPNCLVHKNKNLWNMLYHCDTSWLVILLNFNCKKVANAKSFGTYERNGHVRKTPAALWKTIMAAFKNQRYLFDGLNTHPN